LKAFRGKTVFSGGFGAILEFLDLFEGLGATDMAPAKYGDFSGILWNFLGF
jgi:hypothetical protein